MGDPYDWLHLAITGLTGFGGVAAGYGYLRAKVASMAEVQKSHDERILKLEARGLDLVFKDTCFETREMCNKAFCLKIEELKKMVGENRENVTNKFNQIAEFMGYMKRYMETKKD